MTIVGAFERMLGLRGGDEGELANAFTILLVPNESLKPRDCARVGGSSRQPRYERYASVREVWIRDFFRLRADHAHGKIAPRYTSLWSLREHLLFSAFSFR